MFPDTKADNFEVCSANSFCTAKTGVHILDESLDFYFLAI
jgi:hypothetical protein